MNFDINDRIALLREELGLTQTEFGARFGASRSVISNIEYHKTEPKPLQIDQIVRVYGVRREWLETGEGDMYAELSRREELVKSFGRLVSDEVGDDFKETFINELLKLPPESWVAIRDFCEKLLNKKDGE